MLSGKGNEREDQIFFYYGGIADNGPVAFVHTLSDK